MAIKRYGKAVRRQLIDRHSPEAGQFDDEVIDALATELLGVCMATLKQYGVDSNRLVALAGKTIASVGAIPTASRMFRDVDNLGALANEWTDNPRYVDSSGRPRILSIVGSAPSFAALVSRFFRGRDVHEILDMGCSTGVLEKVGKDKVAQFGGCVMFTGNPVLMLMHAIQSVRWFLTTTLANAASDSLGKALPDRKACCVMWEGDLPEFIQVMRQPLISLVEMGNRWLAARAPQNPPRASQKAVTMGIHAYLFRDPVT